VAALAPIGLAMLAPPSASPVTRTAQRMRSAARSFLGRLTPNQRTRAMFPFESEERENWHFVPLVRKGLPLSAMDTKQREAALNLLRSGLSKEGMLKASTIMALEDVLKTIEKGSGPVRDRDGYHVWIFGTPDEKAAWGWRIEGHHLSISVTLQNGQISSTPTFFGANPAEVRVEHPMKGVRALRAEEEAARNFIAALTPEQRTLAVVGKDAPADILTGEKRQVEPLAGKGLPAVQLDKRQQGLFRKLVGVHAQAMAPELARARLARAEAAGWEKLEFTWLGGTERGQKHYYRIQGPTLLIEYDNTQNDANHIHCVWRDFTGDFGRDLLAEHAAASHNVP
jgi:hypothetical protein